MNLGGFVESEEDSSGTSRERLFRALLRLIDDADPRSALSLKDWLELAEASKVINELRRCNGNRSAAARSLGIGRRTLYWKMDRLGIAGSWTLRALDG